MLLKYIFWFFIFSLSLMAKEEIDFSIDCDLVDLNKSEKISTVNENRDFYYHLSIVNNSKKRYKKLSIESDIPDSIKLDLNQLKKLGCSYNKSHFSCLYPFNNKKRYDIFLKAKSSKTIVENLTTTFFLNVDDNLLSSDTVLINISDIKKFNKKNDKSDLGVSITNQTPKVGDKIGLKIIPSKDIDLLIKLDKKFEFISSNICKKSANYIECRLKKSHVAKLDLKALKYGFSINEISDKASRKILKDLLFDIKRDYIPKLNLTLKSNQDEIISSTRYRYIVDINSLDINQSVKDIEFTLKTTSKDNFKFLKSSSSKWECKQSEKFLRCKTDELKKDDNKSFNIEVLAPDYSCSIKTRASLTPNSNKELEVLDIDVVNIDFDMDNTQEFSLEKEFSGKFKLYKTFGDLFENDSKHSDIGSKIFLEKKSISSAKLRLDSDDEVVYAKLIWMARVDKNIDYEKLKWANRVKFRSKKDSSFKNLVAKLSNFNFKSDDDFLYYSSYIDVTNYIKKYKSGIYELKDIVCSDGFGAYGSWGLVVVVKNKKQKVSKDIKLYYGFDGVYKSENFSNSGYFLDRWGIDLDLQNRLDTQISLYILGGDSQFQDRGVVKDSSEDVLFDKKNIAKSFTNVDINISKSEKSISNLKLYSNGDKFFIGFLSVSQDQVR